jgi:hypothetical protein
MKNHASRRNILQGLIASAVVVGFDTGNHSWVTPANATHSFINLPHLDGVLYVDDATCTNVSDDFGHLVHRYPKAVLKPGSIDDIVKIIRFARTHRLKVAARGQGHTCYGQAQVDNGIVIDISTLFGLLIFIENYELQIILWYKCTIKALSSYAFPSQAKVVCSDIIAVRDTCLAFMLKVIQTKEHRNLLPLQRYLVLIAGDTTRKQRGASGFLLGMEDTQMPIRMR